MSKTFTILLLFTAFCQNLNAQVSPPNDVCDEATAIGQVTNLAFSTIDANTDGPAHGGLCASSGSTPDSCYNDIWYKFTADFTGSALFSLCGTADYDSKIIVYKAEAVCPLLPDDVLACNEDGSGCANYTSQVGFDCIAGKTYILRLGGYGDGSPGEQGSGTFSVNQYFANAPPNDKCDAAITVTLGANDSTSVDFITTDATTDGPQHILQSCFDPGEEYVFNNVWYKWTASFDGYMEWSNCGTSTFDSRMAVYDDSNCPPTTASLVGCSDDGITDDNFNCAGYTSRAIFVAVAGHTYLLSIGGWSGSDQGTGTFTLKKIPPPVIPPNNDCGSPTYAFIITPAQADAFEGTIAGTTSNASFEDIYPRPDCRQTGEHWDVWYEFNSGINTELELRFIPATNAALFIIDLFDSCGNPDTSASKFCVRTDALGTDPVFFVPMTGFSGTPTTHLLRIGTRVTGDSPGNFLFQLVGEPFNTGTDNLDLRGFRFSPNPVRGLATLQFELASATFGALRVTNSLGVSVFEQALPGLNAGQQSLQLPLEQLPTGLYFLNLQLKEGRKTVRFVKE